jgi:hypothetical protein
MFALKVKAYKGGSHPFSKYKDKLTKKNIYDIYKV